MQISAMDFGGFSGSTAGYGAPNGATLPVAPDSGTESMAGPNPVARRSAGSTNSGQNANATVADTDISALTDREEMLEDPEVNRVIDSLEKREIEVRSHEQAHVSAGGPYVRGGIRYSYQQGPDGKQYIAGGEVSIDVSPVSGNPEATVQKMQVVRRAALAPAEPSSQDRSIAAQASKLEAQARAEQSQQESSQDSDDEDPTAVTAMTENARRIDEYLRYGAADPSPGQQLDTYS